MPEGRDGTSGSLIDADLAVLTATPTAACSADELAVLPGGPPGVSCALGGRESVVHFDAQVTDRTLKLGDRAAAALAKDS